MMCRPPGRCTTPFTLSVWPRIVLRGMITSSSVSSFFLTGIWRSQVRQVVQYGCERLPEKPARIKVELKRVVWQQKIFLVSRLAYHIACLRESSPHPEANFSTVYTRVVYQGMRSYLSGYPKSAKFRQAQCSNQWAFGSRLRRLGVRLFMLSFIKMKCTGLYLAPGTLCTFPISHGPLSKFHGEFWHFRFTSQVSSSRFLT